MVVLAMAETGADLVEEDLLLAEAEALIEVGIAEIGQCTKLPVATAEKSAKCLSDPQTVSPSTAAIVLKKWEMAADPIQGDLMTEIVHLRRRVDRI